jgi:hypothetical protein
MKMLARVVTVLALAAFAAPALPCSDMQQTTADSSNVQAPAVAKKDTPQKAKKDTKGAAVAKANTAKPVAN